MQEIQMQQLQQLLQQQQQQLQPQRQQGVDRRQIGTCDERLSQLGPMLPTFLGRDKLARFS
jgi:hypothetical protein